MMNATATKGVLVNTNDEALAKRLIALTKGAPATSYRVQGVETVQYGSLPLDELAQTKARADKKVVIVVGPRWIIILTFGEAARAYQQRVLQALSAADKTTYTLGLAK